MEPMGMDYTDAQEVGITFQGKILLIDDNAEDLEAYFLCLAQKGYDVRPLVSYSHGLSWLDSERFDMIIVSQGSPKFEGRDVLERAIQIDRSMPVVILAPSVDTRCYIDAMCLGALDYVEKPLSMTQLLRLVKYHLRP
jgi:two-component system response regulator PilR (NtrC family)